MLNCLLDSKQKASRQEEREKKWVFPKINAMAKELIVFCSLNQVVVSVQTVACVCARLGATNTYVFQREAKQFYRVLHRISLLFTPALLIYYLSKHTHTHTSFVFRSIFFGIFDFHSLFYFPFWPCSFSIFLHMATE